MKGRIIAITGAGSGIGRELTVQLAKRGCRLSVSDINTENLQETVESAKKHSSDILSTTLDVSNKDSIYKWAEATNAHFDGIDIIINNAGISLSETAENTSDEDFEKVMQVNFWGVVHGSRAFLPYLKNSKNGHIVNLSSLFGLVGAPNQSAYCASKFAVRGFTESLQEEAIILNYPITVSCVHPGGVKTNIVKGGKVGITTDNASPKDYADQFDRVAITSPEKAAKTIIKGIKRKEGRILVGADAKAIDKVQRALPAGIRKMIAWSVKLNEKTR